MAMVVLTYNFFRNKNMISACKIDTLELLIPTRLQGQVKGWADITRIASELLNNCFEPDKVINKLSGEIYP